MPTLSNSYDCCQLLNLGVGPQGRGPFLIRQQGSAPGSMTLDQMRYFLRKDGTWVLSLAVYVLSDAEQEEHYLYPTSADATTLLSSLAGDPVVDDTLPPDKSAEELILAAQKTISGLWGHLNRLNEV
ncbi:hypothetical protein [Verrucomicrobium spinosum]|uniref:hypothetical protein n=1 Tax=Verrucomicrobium spinosum TaxID=2736 RepID=UPI000174500E|nr:hypothetical protein [Verrucomicrobium spinosum]